MKLTPAAFKNGSSAFVQISPFGASLSSLSLCEELSSPLRLIYALIVHKKKIINFILINFQSAKRL